MFGGIELQALNTIVFHHNGACFYLTSGDTWDMYHMSDMLLDLDDGFLLNVEAGYSQQAIKIAEVLQTYFVKWKENNYEGLLFPEDLGLNFDLHRRPASQIAELLQLKTVSSSVKTTVQEPRSPARAMESFGQFAVSGIQKPLVKLKLDAAARSQYQILDNITFDMSPIKNVPCADFHLRVLHNGKQAFNFLLSKASAEKMIENIEDLDALASLLRTLGPTTSSIANLIEEQRSGATLPKGASNSGGIDSSSIRLFSDQVCYNQRIDIGKTDIFFYIIKENFGRDQKKHQINFHRDGEFLGSLFASRSTTSDIFDAKDDAMKLATIISSEIGGKSSHLIDEIQSSYTRSVFPPQ